MSTGNCISGRFFTCLFYIIPPKILHLTAKQHCNCHNSCNRPLLFLFSFLLFVFKLPLKYYDTAFKESAEKHHDTAFVQNYRPDSCIRNAFLLDQLIATHARLITLQHALYFVAYRRAALPGSPLTYCSKFLMQGRVCEQTCPTWHDG